RGPDDPRAGGDDPRRGVSRRAAHVGHVEAGRRAAQAARRVTAARPGLAAPYRPARRDRVDLPLVRRERRQDLHRSTVTPSAGLHGHTANHFEIIPEYFQYHDI